MAATDRRNPLTIIPLLLLLVAGGLPPAHAGEADSLIPRELFFGNPERFRGRISPDGDKISYVAPVEGVPNVWVGPAGNLDAARPVTDDRSRGIRLYYWSASNDFLLYNRDTGGDENDHVFSVDLRSGGIRDLTPFAGARGEVYKISYQRPTEIVVGINARDARYFDLFRVDIASGQLTYLYANVDGYESFVIDEGLLPRAAMKRREDGGSDIYRVDEVESGGFAFEKIAELPPEDVRNSVLAGMMPDGERVYMLDSRGRDKAALVALSLAEGGVELIAESEAADIDSILVEPASNELIGWSVNFKRRQWHGADDADREDFARLERQLPGDANVLGMSRDGDLWIMTAETPERPFDYYLYDRETGQARLLFQSFPELSKYPLRKLWPKLIESRDGLPMVAYLTLPAAADPDGDGEADHGVPMVLLVHGGPWARDAYDYDAYHQWLADRGYAVLSVNYRGSVGFGKAFYEASRREWAAKMHDDLLDAVDWAVEAGVTRPGEVAIMGGSYGGYATLVGLTFTPTRFACGVDIVGPSNLVTLLDSIPPYWASFRREAARMIGDPATETGRAFLAARSPLSRVDAIQRPLLIGQGANDPRVKQAESDQIVAAMQDKDLPVTYVLFPDEGHGFARPENSLAFNAIAEAFLHTCLGGRYQPIGDALAGSSTQVPAGATRIPGLADALAGFEPEIRK